MRKRLLGAARLRASVFLGLVAFDEPSFDVVGSSRVGCWGTDLFLLLGSRKKIFFFRVLSDRSNLPGRLGLLLGCWVSNFGLTTGLQEFNMVNGPRTS